MVGQQPAELSSARNLAGTSSPGRIDLTWSAPTTIDTQLISRVRIEDVVTGTPVVLATRDAGYVALVTLRSPATGPHSLRVVLETRDGREVATSPIPLTAAARWLLATTPHGVLAQDADGGATNGGTLGARTTWTEGIASSPTRASLVVGEVPWEGSVRVYGATGETLRGLTYDPTTADPT